MQEILRKSTENKTVRGNTAGNITNSQGDKKEKNHNKESN